MNINLLKTNNSYLIPKLTIPSQLMSLIRTIISLGFLAVLAGASILFSLVLLPIEGLIFYRLIYTKQFISIPKDAISSIYQTIFKKAFDKNNKEIFILTNKDYPQIFSLVKNICKKLKINKKVNIQIVFDKGAFIYSRRPKIYSIRKELYLNLGIYLLCLNNLEQLESILAHELAHSKSFKNFITQFIFDLQYIWLNFYNKSIDKKNILRPFIKLFSKWYLPNTQNYYSYFSRYNEQQADLLAAYIVGAELYQITLLDHVNKIEWYDEIYFTKYRSKIKRHDEPQSLFIALNKISKKIKWDVICSKSLEKLNDRFTRQFDSHPTLHDRIKFFGDINILPKRIKKTAIDEINDIRKYEILQFFDDIYKKDIKDAWGARHKDFLRQTLLSQLPTPSIDELEECAILTQELYSNEKAEIFYKKLLDIDPNNAEANLFFGNLYIDDNFRKALTFYDIAIDNSPTKGPSICNWLLGVFYQNKFDKITIDHYLQKLHNINSLISASLKERAIVSTIDKLSEITDKDLIEKFKNVLSEFPIEFAFAFKKEITHFSRFPFYVFLIRSSLSPKVKNELTEKLNNLIKFGKIGTFDVNNQTARDIILANKDTPHSLIYSTISDSEREKYLNARSKLAWIQ